MGDGTILTTICDLNEGRVHLFFYHDYTHQVQFRLSDELAKGDHVIEIASLFTTNAEFQNLVDFKTPMNSPTMDAIVRIFLGLFFVSAVVFVFSYLRKRATAKFSLVKLLLAALSLILMYYMFVLGTNNGVYYFPEPYQDYAFSTLNVAASIPFLMILIIIPLIVVNRKVRVSAAWGFVPKWMLTLIKWFT